MLIKRSLKLSGHSTSLALEQAFWDILSTQAEKQQISLTQLINHIDQQRSKEQNLASVCRLKALAYALKGA